MPVTADDIKALVIAEIGDTDDQVIATTWNTIWESYADKATIWPRLQELYSKDRAIDILLGRIRRDVNFTIAASLHGTTEIQVRQRWQNLTEMKQANQKLIGAEELKARAVRPGYITQIQRTEIELPPDVEPPPAEVTANSPLFRGDPYMSPGQGTGTVGPI